MKYIITHAGCTHRDEFLAVAIILAKMKCNCPIYRRDPTSEELKDPDIWVIDIGKQFDENLNNYDHHQFEKEHIPECSISLILKKFNLYYPLYGSWILPTEILDTKGPVELAKYYHMPLPDLHNTMSPIENVILEGFECKTEIIPPDWIYNTMVFIGIKLIGHIQTAAKQIKEAKKFLEIEHIGIVDVMFFKELIHPATAHVLRQELIKSGVDIAVSVMPDNRSEGWKLYRYFDDIRIDFTKCADDKKISFMHINGFVCTTDKKYSKDIIKELILKSQNEK